MTDPIPSPPGSTERDGNALLPSEVLREASGRDVAWVTLGPLLLVVTVNLAIAMVLLVHPSNRGDWLARAKWQLLLDSESREPVDTLILGDSTCNQGLDPDVLGHTLGGGALNLCTTGDKLAVGDAWMLQAYLKRQRAPRRILVMHAYDVWARDEGTLRNVSWTIGQYRDLFEHAEPPIQWTLGERLLLRLGPWVPLYNQPQASLDVAYAPLETLGRRRFSITPAGFMAYKRANPKRVARETRDHLRKLPTRRGPISRINRRALQTLVAVAHQSGAALYVVHAPLFEGLWEAETLRHRHESVSNALEAVLAKSPLARLVSRTPATFSAREMESADHVVGKASTRLTEQVAADLSRLERQ